MKENVIYRIDINKHLFFEILYDGKQIELVDSGNVPEEIIKIVNLSDKSFITVGDIPYITVDLMTGEMQNTSSNVLTTYVRNHSQSKKEKELCNIKAHLSNEREFLFDMKNECNNENEDQTNILELHTHFMEVLSGEEFFNLIKDKITFVDFNEEGNLVDRYVFDKENPTKIERGYQRYLIDEVYKNNKLYNKIIKNLSIDVDKQVDFSEIGRVLNRRLALIELVSYHETLNEVLWLEKSKEGRWKQKIADVRSEARADFYFEMLVASLETLKKQGVKYVEFSYSTAGMITKMIDKLNKFKNIEGISFNFLYSVHRTKLLSAYRKNAPDSNKSSNKSCLEEVLPHLIEEGLVTGFDLMGVENEIVTRDMFPSTGDITGTLYDKIYTALEILTRYPEKNLTLRLHSGETPYDETLDLDTIMNERNNNPQKTLQIIDFIVYNLNQERKKRNLSEIVIPPPNIRIGHGLHFQKTDKYISLLKKYKVIVEINASSNFTLSNIKDLKKLPYNWYLDNGIPIVISTDGGGFYLTTPIDEMKLAEIFAGKRVIKNVKSINEDLFISKTGGGK